MVGAEDIHGGPETAIPLVTVVSEVWSHVGVRTIALDQHPVLVVTELRSRQPQGAFTLVHVVAPHKFTDDLLYSARLVEALLVEEAIETDPYAGQGAPDIVHTPARSERGNLAQGLVAVHIQQATVVLFGDVLRYLLCVVAHVSRFRTPDGPRLPIEPGVAHGDRLAEEPDLVPSIVEVVLA